MNLNIVFQNVLILKESIGTFLKVIKIELNKHMTFNVFLKILRLYIKI